MSVETLFHAIKAQYPRLFVKTRAQFEAASKAEEDRLRDDFSLGLWMSGELTGDGSDIAANDLPLFYYYANDPHEDNYTFGIHHEIDNLAKEHGCWFEWYDCGTLMVYPD